MKRPASQSLAVAAGQLQCRLMNEADQTLAAAAELIREAARQQARLLVLPECAYPAYLLGSVDSYRSGAHLSSRDFVAWLAAKAAEHRIHIVSGFVEDTGDSLFNAAVLLGPDGRELGRTRKRFLWNVDHDWFSPGREVAVFASQIGRIGIAICAEARVPEILATLAAQGAELIAVPTCWINGSRQPGEYRNPQPEFLIEARAREFGLPLICADKSGLEMTIGYVGQSCVATPEAGITAMAPCTGEALVVAEIAPGRARPAWISEPRRARILDPAPARPPRRTSEVQRTIAAVSTAFAEAGLTGGMGEPLFQPLQKAGVSFLAANIPHEPVAERMAMLARAFDMQAVAFPHRADLFDAGGIRTACLAGQWLDGFATSRALALDGAEMLLFFDIDDDLPMLRTRALENRLFVAGVGAHSSAIIGPDGSVLARGGRDDPAVATVDLAEASDKHVAPRTDIFAQRDVATYRF
jgi:predicted amidohydrolase